MPDLKLDLINKITSKKYYDELELIRLGGDDKMNYEQKVNEMSGLLEKISVHNAKLALIESYFQAPPQAQPEAAPVQVSEPQVAPVQVAQPLPGQSHGE